MTTLTDLQSDDIETLRAALASAHAARLAAEARASGAEAMVEQLKLLIAKYKRDKFGQSAERTRQLDQQACWSPLALQAVRRIDLIFDGERAINGLAADKRLELRRAHIAPLVAAFEGWMRSERAKLSRHNDVAKAMDYMLKRWAAFTGFLEDGRICLTNNAAERALRCVAVGRRNWTFCGSDRGGERAAAIYTLIATAKLNDIDPEAWLADVLRRINDHPASRLDELLTWNWKNESKRVAA